MKKLLPALLLTLAALASAQAEDLQIYTHSGSNEFSMIDGKLRGKPHAGKRAFYLELVRAMLADLKLRDEIQEVPLARGISLVQNKGGVALFNVFRTPERENTVKWVGPIIQEVERFYESSRHPSGIQKVEDAVNLPVCALNGSFHDNILTRKGFTRILRVNSYETCFRMMAAGRINLTVSSDLSLKAMLSSANVSAGEIRATNVIVETSNGYIALSKDTADAEVKRWQNSLETIRKSGLYQQLFDEYIN